ncbi:amino acid permease-domain-containing protein, partial [Chytriomyces sp. MP71]
MLRTCRTASLGVAVAQHTTDPPACRRCLFSHASSLRQSGTRIASGWHYWLIYIGSIFLVGVILPTTSPVLTNASISMSPFEYAYKAVGISFASHFMNLVIVVAASSAENSSLYACACTIMRLAEEGSAPTIFARVDKRGVPM